MHLATAQVLIFGAFFLIVLSLLRAFFSIEKQAASTPGRKNIIHNIVARLLMFNSSLPFPKYRAKIQKLLQESGRETQSFEAFLAQQEMYAVAAPAVLWLIIDITDPFMLCAAAALSFYVPYIRLTSKIKKKKKLILADLPFMMDLLTLSVEAGSSFDQAIANIIQNFPERPLKYELQLVSQNLHAGKTNLEALVAMRDRLDMAEISGLCSALIQADQMGTGLGVTLREQSLFIKKKRFEWRRTKAKQAATLMVIPLLLFFFPAMFLIILGPVAIRLYYMLLAS